MLPFAGRDGKVAQKGSKCIMIVMVMRKVYSLFAAMEKLVEPLVNLVFVNYDKHITITFPPRWNPYKHIPNAKWAARSVAKGTQGYPKPLTKPCPNATLRIACYTLRETL